ncbi:guanylate kinase [Fodinibius saliphilus]|uniref:guanylate kinase n=1 Tax=Fodinibius saliphilus TaxID=1920650 RepID=UPI001108460F|nr:guanylate kinase [Fodinibius saliphilus]
MSNKKAGKIIVIVAPSGAGKTTIARKLLADNPKIKFSTSATTRPPRKGEKDGREYYFLSEEEFSRKVKEDDFLEWEEYSGNKYGTLQSEVDKLVESGYFPLLDIEVKGALNVQRIYEKDSLISIFIKPPSMDVLKERLANRGSETDESLSRRLERAKIELQHAEDFDYSVVNDDLETAYTEVKEIIESFITD